MTLGVEVGGITYRLTTTTTTTTPDGYVLINRVGNEMWSAQEVHIPQDTLLTLLRHTGVLVQSPPNREPRYTVGELHGTPVVWEMNECDSEPDPRPLSLARIAEMLNER